MSLIISGMKEIINDQILPLKTVGDIKKILPTGLKLYGCGINLATHTKIKTTDKNISLGIFLIEFNFFYFVIFIANINKIFKL